MNIDFSGQRNTSSYLANALTHPRRCLPPQQCDQVEARQLAPLMLPLCYHRTPPQDLQPDNTEPSLPLCQSIGCQSSYQHGQDARIATCPDTWNEALNLLQEVPTLDLKFACMYVCVATVEGTTQLQAVAEDLSGSG